MRVVYMGTPAFALPTLQAIHNSNHHLIAAVTGRDKRSGRGRKMTPPAVKVTAADLGYPVLQPDSLADEQFHHQLRDLQADIFVVLAFSILPNSVLDIPPRGAINLHPSLLPKYRGAAPIQHALLNGEKTTGLSTIMITSRVDSGDILLQRSIDIEPADDNGSLSLRLAADGASLVVETLDGLQNGTVRPTPQSSADGEAGAPKIRPTDLVIDWSRPADAIVNQIRAFSPTPGASTILDGKRLKLFAAEVGGGSGAAGTILRRDNGLEVAAKTGSVLCRELQIEGKRRMPAADFFRGVTVDDNVRLGAQ